MEPGYILDDSILTMADYQKWMTRGHEAKEPTPRELGEQRLRKYDVIIQHFNQIVSRQTEFVADDERHSQVRF